MLKNIGKGTPLLEKKFVKLDIIIVESKICVSKKGSLSIYTYVSCKFSQCESILESKVMAMGIFWKENNEIHKGN